MSFPPKSAPLRKAVLHVLLTQELEGIVCRFDQLISPLKLLSGPSGDDNFAEVDYKLIKHAFTQNGISEYKARYRDMDVADDSGENFLMCRIGKRLGRSEKIYECGRFIGDDFSFVPNATTTPHPLDLPSFKKKLQKLVPQNVQDDLTTYLIEERAEEKNRLQKKKMKAEKAAKQRLQKEGRAAKLKASKSATKIASRAANKTPPFADSTNLESRSTQRRHSIVVSPMVAHPPNKRRKDSKNEPSPEEMQLLSDSHSLRQRIIAR